MTARDLTVELFTARQHRTFRTCIYCGRPSIGLACAAHRDLLLIDPNQYELRLRTGGGERGTP